MKKRGTKHRDMDALRMLANVKEDSEKMLMLKRALKESGYNLLEEAANELNETKAHCDNNVCYAIVCMFSSSCKDGACSSGGCGYLVDLCGFFSNPDPCKDKTCTQAACGSAASDTNPVQCKTNVCSSKVKIPEE